MNILYTLGWNGLHKNHILTMLPSRIVKKWYPSKRRRGSKYAYTVG